jgi:hypothetical protein
MGRTGVGKAVVHDGRACWRSGLLRPASKPEPRQPGQYLVLASFLTHPFFLLSLPPVHPAVLLRLPRLRQGLFSRATFLRTRILFYTATFHLILSTHATTKCVTYPSTCRLRGSGGRTFIPCAYIRTHRACAPSGAQAERRVGSRSSCRVFWTRTATSRSEGVGEGQQGLLYRSQVDIPG